MGRTAAKKTRSPVPKAMMERYEALTAATDAFCREHLTNDYMELARNALAALCRKRPSPAASGKINTWACGVVYALGQMNFLFDSSSSPYMSAQDLCAAFGVSPSTGGAKAKAVRDALGMGHFDHRWLTLENVAGNPAVWMVSFNGQIIDVRSAPRMFQIQAFEQGVIPYVHANGPGAEELREEILDRYGRYRSINLEHQIELAERLRKGPVADEAVRLGLIKTKKEAARVELDALGPAIDQVFYRAAPNGSEMQQYLRESEEELPEEDREILEWMSNAVFSVFRVTGFHPGAGVNMADLLSGEEIWLMDRGLDLTAVKGTEMATRVFQAGDFWMTTGVAVRMTDAMWTELGRFGVSRTGKGLSASRIDRDALAEALFRLID